jgi:HlyD family secretion protein
MKTPSLILIVLLAALTLSACGGAPTAATTPTDIPTVLADTAIISEGFLEPVRYTEIALNASGLVSEVLVREGEQVEAGQVLARLEAGDAKTLEAAQAEAARELTSAYQAVRDAQFQMDNFDVPSDFAGLTPTQAVATTLEKLNTARKAYEPYEHLGKNNDTGREYKKRLDSAWAKYRRAIQWMELGSNLETANARLSKAQRDYDSLQDASFGEDTAGARAALANAEVRAPFAGIITSLSLKVGEFASAGTPVLTIADTSAWVVKTTDLTEIDVVELAVDDPATITLDAIPGESLKGTVLSIGQSFSKNQGDVVYEVTILLADVKPTMRWGMTAEVKFDN